MPVQEIPVSDAQAGMLTARDIMDNKNRILIHAGSRLSPVAIRRLPLWNIDTIFVEVQENTLNDAAKTELNKSTGNDANSNIDTALISELAIKVKNRFKSIEQDEFYKTYMIVLLKYMVNNNNNGNNIISGLY